MGARVAKVLLIEDDAWLSEIEADFIKKAGFDVRVASNALDGIELVDDFKPDVIVLDVLLDGSTGFALLNELKTYDDTQEIPIILQSNLAESFDARELAGYGIRAVIDKTTMEFGDIEVAIKGVLA